MKRKLIYCFNQNISGLGTSGNDVLAFVSGCERERWPTRMFVYVKVKLIYKQIVSLLAGYIGLLCM